MKVRTKLVKNLTPEEYNKCSSLNMRERGEMRRALPNSKHREGARVILIEENNKLLAWALIRPKGWGAHSYYEGQFYVRVSERRRGLGTKLMNRAKKIHPDLQVCPHDRQSVGFFASIKGDVEIAPGYGWWGEEVKKAKASLTK